MKLKHIYNRLLKRIWSPRVYDYSHNFKKALINTEKLGLNQIDDFSRINSSYLPNYKQFIINEILNQVYSVKMLQLEDLALKCNLVSKELQEYLKIQFDINSVITIGNVYLDKLRKNYEPLSVLKKRLNNKDFDKPFSAHVWLTLENLDIIDLTIAPSIWLEKIMSGIEPDRSDFERVLWISTEKFSKKLYVYEPLLVGYEYFDKATLPIKLIEIQQ